MATFKHHFTEPLSNDNIKEMNGFISCMAALQNHLALVTGYKPERRMVDAVVLLEMISETTDQFTPMMENYRRALLQTENQEINTEMVNQ